jgi:hypothetical protein
MGTKHKILEDFYDESFVLIALHSNLEDHVLAYALNSTIKTRFKRSKHDIDTAENFSFPMFEWFDEKTESNWALFPNRTFGQGEASSEGLFKDIPSSAKQHLVPEHKEVDYFIKTDQEVVDTFLKNIQKMPTVITAYMVDCDKLNSKNNLIF